PWTRLELHPGDLLIRFQDLVPEGDGQVQSELGLGSRDHHLMEALRLTPGEPLGLHLRLNLQLVDRLQLLVEQLLEARRLPGRLPLLRQRSGRLKRHRSRRKRDSIDHDRSPSPIPKPVRSQQNSTEDDTSLETRTSRRPGPYARPKIGRAHV